jgi:hypothetical protein
LLVRIITAPTTASRHIHTPHSVPTAAVAHGGSVQPEHRLACLEDHAPAPKKPMPVTSPSKSEGAVSNLWFMDRDTALAVALINAARSD